MNETGEPPSPKVFYAVVSNSDSADALRIAFGPVYLEELARRALDALHPRDRTLKVHRREIRPQPAHYSDGLSNERAMLNLAESDPLKFGTMVNRGIVDPIVVRGFPLVDSTVPRLATDV